MAEESKIRVIAIDDDEGILETYEAVLAAVCIVKTFSNPKEAKAFLETAGPADIPDVILMDIMMPGIGGLVLMSHIHAMPNTAHIPVITVSGKNDSDTIKDAMLFGAAAFVAKPFEFMTLRTKILQAFEASKKPSSGRS